MSRIACVAAPASAARRSRQSVNIILGRFISDEAGVPVVMEAGERKGGVNEVGSEPFPGSAIGGRDAISLVGGKAGMVEAVKDIDGGLADTVGGEQVFNHMVAKQQHELLRIQRGIASKLPSADQTHLLAMAWMWGWRFRLSP